MNVYLKNYCRSLFNCKGVVSINDTQKYISNNEFDINEIISYFQECININDIFNLVNSNEFYKGHSLKEKYLLLIQFFNTIHNYSKNLILRYDVYSTKSIKKTTANIKDCLMYIPHYENYLLDLLGYNYDDEKSEWNIDSEMSLNGNFLFAATCVLCGYAHQKLTKIMEETNFPEDDDVIISNQSTSLDKENNWSCMSCSYSNDSKSVNCEMCFHARKMKVEKSDKQLLVAISRKNQWSCSECTFVNEVTNDFCHTCNSPRKLSISGSNSALNSTTTPSKSHQKARVLSERISVNPQKERPTTSEKNIIKRQSSTRWKCTRCTFLNKEENLNCEACSEKCEERITIKPILFSLQDRTNSRSRDSTNTMKRCKSEYGLIDDQPDKWTCKGCTYVNKEENLNCVSCSMERNVTTRIPYINKTYPQTIQRNTTRSTPNDIIKRSKSEHHLPYRQPNFQMSYPRNNKNSNLNVSVPQKPDVKGDNQLKVQSVPRISYKSPKVQTENLHNNRPSNKPSSNVVQNNQNPPNHKARTLINSTKEIPKKNKCKYCKKEKSKNHRFCKFRSYLCMS